MDIKIDELIEKRKDLFKQVEAIDTVLKIFGHKAEDYIFDNNTVENNSNSKVFPIKARLEKQILWVFENVITKGMKLKEVQKIFNEYVSTPVSIDNKSRSLKSEGQLIVVKYNDKHVHSFWGLPSWIEGTDFKAEHRPEEASLPNNVTSSEINDK
jgi:hypothetical protein